MLLLAHTDTLHGTLSGLATKKLMERAYGIFGDVLTRMAGRRGLCNPEKLSSGRSFLRETRITKHKPLLHHGFSANPALDGIFSCVFATTLNLGE